MSFFIPKKAKCFSLFQVSVYVRDKADHSVMSIENLLKHFRDEVAAFH
jgi:hypothetical protein